MQSEISISGPGCGLYGARQGARKERFFALLRMQSCTCNFSRTSANVCRRSTLPRSINLRPRSLQHMSAAFGHPDLPPVRAHCAYAGIVQFFNVSFSIFIRDKADVAYNAIHKFEAFMRNILGHIREGKRIITQVAASPR